MIFKGSRYENQPIVMVTGLDMTTTITFPTVFGSPPTIPSRFFYYQVKQGDRFDLIAFQFFQRPDLWWYIADANPEIFYPEDLTPGIIIRIPAAS